MNWLRGLLIAKYTLGFLKKYTFSSVVAYTRLSLVIVILIYTLISLSVSLYWLDKVILIYT
jgi:hypothetical protein